MSNLERAAMWVLLIGIGALACVNAYYSLKVADSELALWREQIEADQRFDEVLGAHNSLIYSMLDWQRAHDSEEMQLSTR